MTEEDFIAWRDQPVTRWFMAAFRNSAALCKRQWHEQSWQSGIADQAALSDLRAKASVFQDVYQADFADIAARQDEHERD